MELAGSGLVRVVQERTGRGAENMGCEVEGVGARKRGERERVDGVRAA